MLDAAIMLSLLLDITVVIFCRSLDVLEDICLIIEKLAFVLQVLY